jgi:8-oxo-dGTP pyrophosphatase MutT (NUDIX family)
VSERRVRDDQLPKGAGTAGEVVPIPAASVILLRGEPFEVLLMRRNERSSFVPGAWVFPGGTLDEADCRDEESEDRALRRCAVRELFEETGIWLGEPFEGQAAARRRLLGGESPVSVLDVSLGPALDDLVLTARWVTPVGVPKRFDTRFFLASVGSETEGTPDESEGLELLWLTPSEALRRHHEGSLPMVFPTIRTLEDLATFPDQAALVESRRGATIPVTQPVLVMEGGQKKIVIPGEE